MYCVVKTNGTVQCQLFIAYQDIIICVCNHQCNGTLFIFYLAPCIYIFMPSLRVCVHACVPVVTSYDITLHLCAVCVELALFSS